MAAFDTEPALDAGRLGAWLRRELGLGPVRAVRRLAGGNSNETYLLELDGGDGRFVLRRPPAEGLSPSAHNVAREHRVLTALAGTAVAAPEALALCEDAAVSGAPFVLMAFVDGVAITDQLPPAYPATPETRQALGHALIDALADLHGVDWRGVGLEGLGRPEGFLGRQVRRWRGQFEGYRVRDLPRFDEVAAWLEANRPPEAAPALLHGDYHLDNTLFAPSEVRLAAIVDWEMATVGDPLLDLGLLLAFWGERPVAPCAMPRIQAVSRAPGAPGRRELAARYAERTGRSVEHLPYYLCLAFWKLAAIVEGAYANFARGLDDREYARALGDDVPRLLEEAAAFRGFSAG